MGCTCGIFWYTIVPMSTPEERMSQWERRKAIVLANAGVANLKHLAVLANLSHVTVWRYWNTPPRRKDIVVVTAMAEALEITWQELAELLAEGNAGNGYCPLMSSDLRVSGF